MSYTHHDKEMVRRIAADLQSMGLDVWLDEWQIRGGDSISDRVQQGLRQYDVLLAMLSRKALASPWVADELRVAYRRRARSQRKIIPVLLEELGDEMPELLDDYKYVSFADASSYDRSLGELGDSILLDSQLQVPDGDAMALLNHLMAVSVHLHGDNFELAEFSEQRVAVPRKAGWEIRFEMAPEGKVVAASATGATLERKPLRRTSEEWILRPVGAVIPGRSALFELNWTIEDEYAEEGSPSWYYALDSPTRELRLELVFDRNNDPPHLRCELRRTVARVADVHVSRTVEDEIVRYAVYQRYATPGFRYQFIWGRLTESGNSR